VSWVTAVAKKSLWERIDPLSSAHLARGERKLTALKFTLVRGKGQKKGHGGGILRRSTKNARERAAETLSEVV